MIKEKDNLAKYFKYGVKFLRDCVATPDAKKIIKDEGLRIRKKHGKDASITFLKGIRHGYTFFKDGYEYKISNPKSSDMEDEKKIEEVKSLNGDLSADAFYYGMLYAYGRIEIYQKKQRKRN